MTKKQYDKRCKALFEKARAYGLELLFQPRHFSPQRLNCLWHGGEVATIKVTDSMSIELNAYGDVCATLLDKKGNELARVKDKRNTGSFLCEMAPYLKNDRALKRALYRNRLILDHNNWIEYDGRVRTEQPDKMNVFVDLGIVCDNVLDDDILSAIEEALDSHKTIVEEIQWGADRLFEAYRGGVV